MSDQRSMVPYTHRGYGAIELKQCAQMAMTKAMIISTTLMFGSVGSFYAAGYINVTEDLPPYVRPELGKEVIFAPSIPNQQTSTPVDVATEIIKPSKGIIVLVPDGQVDPEQTIATQTELSQEVGSNSEIGDWPGQSEENVPPLDFVPHEMAPKIVTSIKPVYPELALRTGIEGNVQLKIWVDKEGKVRKALITKSDSPIFDQAAIHAAMQHVFTPALMQDRPVAVWVAIRFRFQLANGQ